MRKRLLAFLMVLCLCQMPQMVWAAEVTEKMPQGTETEKLTEAETVPESEKQTETEKNQSESEQTESNQSDVIFQIDDTHIYEGMEKAYKDGYEPTVADDKVQMVLPLVAEDMKAVSSVTVTPNLGDAGTVPFVYKNYQKTFKATEETVNGTKDKKQVFLVSYTFPLKSDRKNGTYPVVFAVSAKADGQEIQQSFTLYVTIADEKKNDTVKKDSTSDVSVSNDGENSSDESEKPTSEPKLIITKCQSDPERLEAGKDFTLNVEIKNTSKIKYVQNMTIDVTCAETNLTLKADSNTFFFDRLGSNETLKLPLTFSTSAGIQEGRYDIQLSMSYDNPDASSLSSSGTISVDIHQPLRVELEADELPDSINAGDTMNINVQALNLGQGAIYNARCVVDAPGLSTGTSAYIGSVEAGSAANGTLKIFAGMKESSADGEMYGETSGKLILSYEDEDGQTYTAEKEISTVINPLDLSTDSSQTEEKKQGVSLQWYIGVIAAVVILGTAGVIIYRRKAKQHEQE